MVSIEWCRGQRNGLRLVEPNENVSDSYLSMAGESIRVLSLVRDSPMWSAVTSYYVFYQSLYALMRRIGVKCEMHACSLEFMVSYLKDFYDADDFAMFRKAFDARTDLQYYSDRPVDTGAIAEISAYCKVFFDKTKKSLARISDSDISRIRGAFEKDKLK